MVPGQDLVGPGDDGVDDVVELGQFAGLVEVTEPVECFKPGSTGGVSVGGVGGPLERPPDMGECC